MRIAAKTYDLVPDCVTTSDGRGPVIDCRRQRGELLVVTLAIDSVVEQESIAVSIWGSPDGAYWDTKPLAGFTEKSYCALYSILLNLADHPDIQYLRAQWTLRRWDKSAGEPMFVFHVYAEPSGSRLGAQTIRAQARKHAPAVLRAAS
jgi:hypothetical protein